MFCKQVESVEWCKCGVIDRTLTLPSHCLHGSAAAKASVTTKHYAAYNLESDLEGKLGGWMSRWVDALL